MSINLTFPYDPKKFKKKLSVKDSSGNDWSIVTYTEMQDRLSHEIIDDILSHVFLPEAPFKIIASIMWYNPSEVTVKIKGCSDLSELKIELVGKDDKGKETPFEADEKLRKQMVEAFNRKLPEVDVRFAKTDGIYQKLAELLNHNPQLNNFLSLPRNQSKEIKKKKNLFLQKYRIVGDEKKSILEFISHNVERFKKEKLKNSHDPILDELSTEFDLADLAVELFRKHARDANLLEAVDESLAQWGIPIRKQVDFIFARALMEIKEVKDK